MLVGSLFHCVRAMFIDFMSGVMPGMPAAMIIGRLLFQSSSEPPLLMNMSCFAWMSRISGVGSSALVSSPPRPAMISARTTPSSMPSFAAMAGACAMSCCCAAIWLWAL